jgi:hypothetical protein
MIPLPFLLKTRKAAICHCPLIWCCNCGVPKEVIETSSNYTAKGCRVFLCPLLYRDPVQILQECSSCPVLRLHPRPKNDVWFYVLMIISSKSMSFFHHQNKGRPALRVEISSLYTGDSNFDHVLLHSPTVPRLARIHQKTFTMHSHWKRGVVGWRWGMWGNGIFMHPKISLSVP